MSTSAEKKAEPLASDCVVTASPRPDGSLPVSYTHLDVYKRQPQACGWNWHAGDQALLAARFAGRSHFGTRMPEGCLLYTSG